VSTVRERVGQSKLIDRVERVDLRVRDVERASSFYRDVVGLEATEEAASRVSFRSPGGSSLLTLDEEGVSQPADHSATGLFHVAIRFPTRPALGDALARLVDAGYEIGAGDHLVSEALYIDDPDGNGVELYWDRPREQWPAPREDAAVPMPSLPVDLQSVMEDGQGAGAVGGVAPAGTDVGHVHLQVSDIASTTRFYVQELGLDLTMALPGSAGFFSSNGYHHHIGANSWRSRGGRPAAPQRAGLDKVVFAAKDTELDSLRARLSMPAREESHEGRASLVVNDPDGINLHFVAV
jgi:catechol 2,3-dioxygenase